MGSGKIPRSFAHHAVSTVPSFGSFEITRKEDPQTGRAGPSPGKHELTKQLLDFVIEVGR